MNEAALWACDGNDGEVKARLIEADLAMRRLLQGLLV